MVTTFPTIVATEGLVVVYWKVPGRLEDGSTRVNGASPYILMLFSPSVNVSKTVVLLFTVSVAWVDAAV